MRAWLIDLDGTLYRAPLVKLAMGCELLLRGWSVVGPLRTFRHEHEVLRRELDDQVASPFQLQLERAAPKCGLPVDALEAIVREWMVRRPTRWLGLAARADLLSGIAAFRAGGGKVGLVSDYPASEKLRALGAEDLFDIVIANGESGGPGRLKPWPDGYLLAAERLGVAPAECLVIGDRVDADGEAAEAAGMPFFLASRGVPIGDGSGNSARSPE